MPCNSEYMSPSNLEIQMSRVMAFIDELSGGELDKRSFDGYHPDVYGKPLKKEFCDDMVARLCSMCKAADVAKHSLELQIWWRDHQKADRAREMAEAEAAKLAKIKASVIAKLTREELKALGIK